MSAALDAISVLFWLHIDLDVLAKEDFAAVDHRCKRPANLVRTGRCGVSAGGQAIAASSASISESFASCAP
jgi:hypothetical protein